VFAEAPNLDGQWPLRHCRKHESTTHRFLVCCFFGVPASFVEPPESESNPDSSLVWTELTSLTSLTSLASPSLSATGVFAGGWV